MVDGTQEAGRDAGDAGALARVAAGDRTAFDGLVRLHGAALRRFARSLLGDASAADDAVQQGLVDAFRGASTFRGEGSVRSWLFVLTRNAARRQGRRGGSERPASDEPALLALGVSAGWGSVDPERAAMRAERGDRLARALSALPEVDREVLLLRDVEQLDTGEAARALGLGERALKSRLHRARLRLAATLRREEEGDADV